MAYLRAPLHLALCLSLAVPAGAVVGDDDLDDAETYIIDLGEPHYRHLVTSGVDVPLHPAFGIGLLFGYRLRRSTNFTGQDLRVLVVGAPRIEEDADHADSGPIAWLGTGRFKSLARNFDFPWLYTWSRYEAKTSSDEDLNLRAAFSSGWGARLWPFEGLPLQALDADIEVGILVDYANLDAYSEGVANGYLWGGMTLDYDVSEWRLYAEGSSSLQLTDAELKVKGEDTQVDVNQTRVEIDVGAAIALGHGMRLSAGGISSLYLLQLLGDEGTPDTAVTVYLALQWDPTAW